MFQLNYYCDNCFLFTRKTKLIESFSYLLVSHLCLDVEELGLRASCYVLHLSAFMKLLMPLIYLPFSARLGFLLFFFKLVMSVFFTLAMMTI